MRLNWTLTLATIFSIAAASSVTQRQQAGKFRLKTGGSSNNEHNSLYVKAYHTGSASNDAVLTPELNSSATFFLNGTNAQYDSGLSIPWGIDLGGDENNAREWIVANQLELDS